MENSTLQALLSTSEEIEEPCPKKLKTDRSHLSSMKEKEQLLERLCYVDKSLNKPLSFPKILCSFSQNSLELQEKNCKSFKTNVRISVHFKLRMNANLQSRLLGNIPCIEKWAFESKYCSITKDVNYSEINEKDKSLITKSESWALYAKEREKSIENGSISKQTELPTGSIYFYDTLAEKLLARMECLFRDVLEFQNNENDKGFHDVWKMLRSEQYHIPKPITDSRYSNRQTLHLSSPASSFMEGRQTDFESLFYEYKNVDQDSNTLSCKKKRRCPANNNFRRNKVFQHMYMPYSRNCGVLNAKLVKCANFELFLADKRIHNWSTTTENNDTSICSQIILLNTQQRLVSDQKSTKECFMFSSDTIEDDTFLIVGNEKEQMERLLLSNNQITPDHNLNSSILWEESLHGPKTMHNLTTNMRLLNYLTVVPTIFEKLSIKPSNLQTVVTMKTYIQKENKRALNENSAFPNKKFKTSQFGLSTQNKNATGKFRNSIHFIRQRKYVGKYIGTCSRAKKDKKRYINCEDCQENPCGFIDQKAHLPPFDTFKKICLDIDSEEVDQISSIRNVILNDENNEKYSKECTATDKRITSSSSGTLIYSCILPKLFTSCNSLLEQESKGKSSQNTRNINTNIQWPKNEISSVPFPMNDLNSGNILKYFSDVDLYFFSAMSHDFCITQNIAIRVKAQHSKIAPHGKRRKQSRFVFEKNTCVLQYQFIRSFRVSNRLKHPEIIKVENVNFLLQKDNLLSCTHNSDLMPVKQNAEDANKTGNAIEQSYTSKGNRHQNLTLLCECGKCLGTKDKLSTASCTRQQKHLEDATENNFSSEINKKCEFEMKKQFDLVLEELHMFNDISRENENSLPCGEKHIPETDLFILNHSDSILDDDSKNVCENKANMTSPTSCTTVNYTAMVKQNTNEQSLFKDTVLERLGEQEVHHEYCSSSISDEELFCSSSEEKRDSRRAWPSPWNSAFMSHMKEESYSLQTQRGNSLLGGIIRVQPLKTCRGPLRVGLSRKAKPKQLHPYLK